MSENKPAKTTPGDNHSAFWYERDPNLLEGEKIAMANFFPSFKLEKLENGQLCWIGTLNPNGIAGGIWTVMALYENNHPNNSIYGGSIKIYPIRPNLNELRIALEKLPHVLHDNINYWYIATTCSYEVNIITSAASHLLQASKWIFLFEGWLDGSISEEKFFGHKF